MAAGVGAEQRCVGGAAGGASPGAAVSSGLNSVGPAACVCGWQICRATSGAVPLLQQ